MTAINNQVAKADRSGNVNHGAADAQATPEKTNPSTFVPTDFSLAVIGVLTPFGVVSVVTTDRHAKALSYN